jgi:hypothetical protein
MLRISASLSGKSVSDMEGKTNVFRHFVKNEIVFQAASNASDGAA